MIDFDKDLGDDDDDDYDDDDANFTLTPRMVRHSVVETYDNDDHFDLVYIVFVWVSLKLYHSKNPNIPLNSRTIFGPLYLHSKLVKLRCIEQNPDHAH